MDVTNWWSGLEVHGKLSDPRPALQGGVPFPPSISALPKAPPTQDTMLAIVSQLMSLYGVGEKTPNEDDEIRIPVLRELAQNHEQQQLVENKP